MYFLSLVDHVLIVLLTMPLNSKQEIKAIVSGISANMFKKHSLNSF